MRTEDEPQPVDSPGAVPSSLSGSCADSDTLIQQLHSSKGLTRERAREALARIGLCAVPALLELLESPVVQLRWEGAKALGEIARPEAVPALVRLLEDEDHGVRWVAATGLTNVGRSCLPFVLHRLVEDPGSKSLRETAHSVLRAMSERYQELVDTLAPVMAVLGELDPAGAIPPRAFRALQELVPIESFPAIHAPLPVA